MATQSTLVSPQARASRVLHYGLWGGQLLLAAMFGMAGFAKATTPLGALADAMPWTADVPAALVRFIGVAELSAAIGLILPAALRIQPRLVPLAAAGLLTVMALATPFHIARGEPQALMFTLPAALLAGFVAWGRFSAAPIEPRS